MAIFTDATAFAKHVSDYGHKVERATLPATKAAAEVAAIAIRQAGSRYRVKGRRGGKFGLGAKVEGPYAYGGNYIAYVVADPAGFWAIIEGKYKKAGWWITPRGVTQGRRQRRGQRGAQALFASGYSHPIARPVWHPAGKAAGHPWEQGVAMAGQLSTKAFEREIVNVFAKAA